jgi:glycosyltransferase involved in cell wall biosynthesis
MFEPGKQNSVGEKMRVLRIAHASLTPTLRERERALARGYPNVDLEVVTTERWREAEVNVEAADDDLFPVTKARARLSKHVQLFAYDPAPLIAALRRHRPHLIDLNSEPYSTACAEVLTLCNWFAPSAAIVLQTCQNIFHRYPPPFNWLERRALKRIDAAYPCSETARELLRAKGFEKLAPIVPFGVNTEVFKPRPARGNGDQVPTIGFVGRMLPGKGLNVLSDALAKLGARNWKLLVVGDGSERRSFEQSLAEHGVIDRTQFVGAINYDCVPEFYQQIDILVVPTQTTKRIREQFGRVIVEAMASGVAVIGSTCGAIPEVIDSAGFVVPEGDGEALAGALLRLLSNPLLRKRLSEAGRRRVEEHYSWERVADKTYELFRQVLSSQTSAEINQRLELALEPEGAQARDRMEIVVR